ncbi:MAG: TIGR04423 family type III CRISPR-associated protein, partial [Bacteroidota bacterium]
MITTIKQLCDIPPAPYEGYLWWSDQTHPDLLRPDQEIDFSQVPENPFLLEGALYWPEQQRSIMIRYSGSYHISHCDLQQLPSEAELYERAYLPHRLSQAERVYFQELWLPEADPYCTQLPVLRLRALIFSGFSTRSNASYLSGALSCPKSGIFLLKSSIA